MIYRMLYKTFKSFVKRTTESRTVSGSEFHIAGPEYKKLRCPWFIGSRKLCERATWLHDTKLVVNHHN